MHAVLHSAALPTSTLIRLSLISVDVGSAAECRTAPADRRGLSGRSFQRRGSSWSIACRRCRGTSGDRVPVWIAIEFRVHWIPTRVSSVRTACMQLLQVLQSCHLLLCSRSPAVLIPLKLLSSLQRNLYLRFYPYSNGCS